MNSKNELSPPSLLCFNLFCCVFSMPVGVNQFDYSIANLIDKELARASSQTLSQSIKSITTAAPTPLKSQKTETRNSTKLGYESSFQSVQSVSRISPVLVSRSNALVSQRSGSLIAADLISSSAVVSAPKSARGLTPRLATSQSIQSMLNIPEVDSLDEEFLEPMSSGLTASAGIRLALHRANSDTSLDSNTSEPNIVRIGSASNLFSELAVGDDSPPGAIATTIKDHDYSQSQSIRDLEQKIDGKKLKRSQLTLGSDVTTDSSTFLKCRIQRAMADLHTQFERGQAEDAELRCQALEREIATMKDTMVSEGVIRTKEERALQIALDESRERVRLLTLLNIEASRLLRSITK